MLSPKDSPRGQLLARYVRARVVDMTGIDIGLYDFDPHASIFFFIVSPEEDIYLRYGGRDAVAADAYLDLSSFERALELGLEQHARWRSGELPERSRPRSFFPRDIGALRKTEMNGRRSCVECHHIGDYQAAEMERAGKLDKARFMFRSPDIRNIGIHLDVPQGLTVARVSGAAEKAGLSPGDRIVALNDSFVLTFGDFLYAYDALDRTSTGLRLRVKRGGSLTWLHHHHIQAAFRRMDGAIRPRRSTLPRPAPRVTRRDSAPPMIRPGTAPS